MDKNIPLSDLIRIGSKITKHCQGAISRYQGEATCALGAALTAKRGHIIKTNISSDIAVSELNCFPNATTMFTHPIHHYHCYGLASIIIGLNDGHDWSREKIADWLESIGY